MRILVAGSSGLIGTALVPALRGAGHEVRRLVRRPPTAPDEYRWDPPAGSIADATLDGVQAIVNLCGAGIADQRWTHARKQVLTDSRIEPTEVLAGAAADHGVGVLINGSAVGFYGDRGDRTITESDPAGEGFLAELCVQWEAATATAARAGVRVVRMRTGLVLSRSSGLLSRLRPLFSLALGGRLGDGRQYMPWISLDDVISAIRFLLEQRDVSGPVNLTGPEPVTNAEFTRTYAQLLGRPAPWVVPRFALRAALGDLADEGLLASWRAVPAVLQRGGFGFTHNRVAEALRATQ